VSAPAPDPYDDEFFVGYLDTPPRTRGFALRAAALLCLAFLGAGALAVLAHSAPATARLGPEVTLTGVLDANTYGLLWRVEDGRARPYLLARGGKLGFPDASRHLDGHVVTVHGGLLERDGYRMVELASLTETGTLDAADAAILRALPRRELGARTVTGEIVDSKCWLGRMRPGVGRTHRACAQYCISGGMPPVLVARGASGEDQDVAYVLVRGDGRALSAEILPFVAEPVRVTGTLERHGELRLLRIDPATGVQRL